MGFGGWGLGLAICDCLGLETVELRFWELGVGLGNPGDRNWRMGVRQPSPEAPMPTSNPEILAPRNRNSAIANRKSNPQPATPPMFHVKHQFAFAFHLEPTNFVVLYARCHE
jgi:hypothetical protein